MVPAVAFHIRAHSSGWGKSGPQVHLSCNRPLNPLAESQPIQLGLHTAYTSRHETVVHGPHGNSGNVFPSVHMVKPGKGDRRASTCAHNHAASLPPHRKLLQLETVHVHESTSRVAITPQGPLFRQTKIQSI